MIDQGFRLSILSTVSVTSGIIFSAAEAKLTSFIGMTIFNNGLQFIIGEEEKFRAMISAIRKFSRDYKLPLRRRYEGSLLISVVRIISITNVIIY